MHQQVAVAAGIVIAEWLLLLVDKLDIEQQGAFKTKGAAIVQVLPVLLQRQGDAGGILWLEANAEGFVELGHIASLILNSGRCL